MSRDYKISAPRREDRRNGGSLLTGILIGLILGIFIALGVAWYINRLPSPFSTRPVPAPLSKSDNTKAPTQTAKVDDKASRPEDAKPRFDFYKILPGEEGDRPSKDVQKSTGTSKDAFFLQAGAFQNAPDADNLKARLALLGIEASIETSAVQDKGVWHRVRIGPYTSVEELNRTRDTLKQNGMQTTLIKQREPER